MSRLSRLELAWAAGFFDGQTLPMTRDEFYTERLALYLGEGMAMEAAKARASGVTCAFYPSLAIDGDAIAKAIATERERCAIVVENMGRRNGRVQKSHKVIAAEIRSARTRIGVHPKLEK